MKKDIGILVGLVINLTATIIANWLKGSEAETALQIVLAVFWFVYFVYLLRLPTQSQRVNTLRSLLVEAADKVEEPPIGDTKATAKWAWMIHETIPELLRRSLVPGAAGVAEYKEHLVAHSGNEGQAASSFLRSWAARIKANDIEPTFLMPSTFTQFAGVKEWPTSQAFAD